MEEVTYEIRSTRGLEAPKAHEIKSVPHCYSQDQAHLWGD